MVALYKHVLSILIVVFLSVSQRTMLNSCTWCVAKRAASCRRCQRSVGWTRASWNESSALRSCQRSRVLSLPWNPVRCVNIVVVVAWFAYSHLLGWVDQPPCPLCHRLCVCLLTVACVLIECSHYNPVRQWYFSVTTLRGLVDAVKH